MKRRMFHLTPVLLVALLVVAMVMPAAAHAAQRIHVVSRGETLSGIAYRYGTSVSAVASANGITNTQFIWAGQRLVIPGSSGYSGGGSSGGSVHVVGYGDTVGRIAARYGTSVAAIASANGLSNPSLIYVGQRLTIPGRGGGGRGGGGSSSASGGVHVVQRGQTVSSIAVRYGTSVAAIASANGLRNPSLVYVGQRLTIPRGGGGTGGGGSTGGSSSGGSGKWIEVDLSSQRVYARSGNTVVKSFVVSTGTSQYPTVTGRFRVYAKYSSTTMSGPGYYLPGVPWTMYYYKGYAIHGTYWHNNFGRPMSHGCINMRTGDAAWLYSWAPHGTLVVVHW
jgi:LysM repeat protein